MLVEEIEMCIVEDIDIRNRVFKKWLCEPKKIPVESLVIDVCF